MAQSLERPVGRRNIFPVWIHIPRSGRRLKTLLFKQSFLDIIMWYWLHVDFSCLFQLWDGSAVLPFIVFFIHQVMVKNNKNRNEEETIKRSTIWLIGLWYDKIWYDDDTTRFDTIWWYNVYFYKRLLYSCDVFIHNMFVTMVFYSNLCFIVNLMSFTVSGQPFRTMFYVSMHFCDFTVVFFTFFSVCSLSVSLPGLANNDVQSDRSTVVRRTWRRCLHWSCARHNRRWRCIRDQRGTAHRRRIFCRRNDVHRCCCCCGGSSSSWTNGII